MAESEDSELAAILDDGLFGGNESLDNEGEAGDGHVPADDQTAPGDEVMEQQPKRARTDAGDSNVLDAEPGTSKAENEAASICPPHPGWWMDMCIRCGAVRPPPDSDAAEMPSAAAGQAASASNTTKIKHLHHRQALEVSAHEAARIATDGVQRLLASRRLVLVLDLDHTLLNTVRDIDLVGLERQLAQQQLEQQAKQLQLQHQGQSGAAAAASSEQPQQQQDNQSGGKPAGHDVSSSAAGAAAAGGNTDGSSAAANDGSSSLPAAGETPKQQLVRPRLYHLADKGLWTKLRPGVEAFLASVSQMYELHIYTMGDKGYAGLMADLLDPEHKLFVGRVISAADSTRAGVKDLDVLLADESLVLILDDTEHVWENHRANLIQVERYHYFGASARLFHPGAGSPLEQGTDEPETGGVLDQAAQLLARIHERVFGPAAAAATADKQQPEADEHLQQPSETVQAVQEVQQQPDQQQQQLSHGRRGVRRPGTQPQAAAGSSGAQQQQQQQCASGSRPCTPGVLVHDVRECLAEERRSILAGCCIVFSRCWPQHQAPEEHPLWQLVVRLGGSCSLSFKPGRTSHVVVAPDKGDIGGVPLTDKVQAAQRAGVPVVHPDWLLACKFGWCRQPEAAFALPGYTGSSSARLLGPIAGSNRAAAERERQAVMKAAGRADG